MQLFQKPRFQKAYKKLHPSERDHLNKAIRRIIEEPLIGEAKVGDLRDVRIHKVNMNRQLTLLAYIYEENVPSITLLVFGSHENFYRDLKN